MQQHLFIGGILLLINVCSVGSFAATDCPLLDTTTATAQLATLTAEVRYHNRLYYQELRPVLSDVEYDKLYARLLKMEECFPRLVSADSPTRRVASAEIDPKLLIPHAQPMLSLAAAADETAVAELLTRVRQVAPGEVRYLVQPKFDGLPLELLYVKGRLVAAATRGDGLRGEDVTAQAQKIAAIPQRLSGDFPARLVIRGELYARRGRAEDAPLKADSEPYATLRHQAAATLRKVDATPEALAALDFFPYEVVDPEKTLKMERSILARLSGWGFPDPLPLTSSATTLDGIRKVVADALAARPSWPFAADGMVVKVDDLALRRTLGEGSREPNWAAAWKFPPATAVTTVTEIVWQTGRTGRRTPVATLAPCRLAGIEVQRVTLHNAEELAALDLIAGDEVLVALSGDVIPQIVAVTKRLPRLAVMAAAPLPLPRIDDCYVLSTLCEEQFLGRASYFVSENGLNIAGLGPGRLRSLIRAGLVKDLPSLLLLTPEEIASVDGIGEVTAKKIALALQSARHPQPWRLLAGLGVENVGPKALMLLQERYGTLGALVQAPEEELSPLVGVKASTSLARFFASEEGRRQLTLFAELGLCGKDLPLLDWLKRSVH